MDPSFVRRAVLPAMVLCGVAITAAVFWPGVMNWDSRYVYTWVSDLDYGDWQPPIYTLIWWVTDRILPGPAGMFVVFLTLFWSAVLLLARHVATWSPWRAIFVVLLALTPPVFAVLGVLWRDVFFACCWLLAVALALTSVGKPPGQVWLLRAVALGLVLLGYLLRSNALFAAPFLVLYVIRPEAFSWKRMALLYLPLVAALYVFLNFMFYTVMEARRENPLHSLFVFDIGGVSHFSGKNRFPVAFTPEQTRMIETECYDPEFWDAYWTVPKCKFVMQRLEKEEKVFGTPVLRQAWIEAITSEPVAYAAHRFAYFRNLTTAHNLVLWTYDVYDPAGQRRVHEGRVAFNAHWAVTDWLNDHTPVFRPLLYLGLCVVLGVIGWRRREDARGALAVTLALSGAFYLLTYLPFGVASDYRYGYWVTLAALFGLMLTVRAPPVSRG